MKPSDTSEPLPPRPAAAEAYLGDQLGLMTAFGEHLADTGVSHGLIGPREVPRLWDRHILNCAVVTELIAPEERVADVGSGAGLPGLVIAIARPDLHVTLIEPLLRRVTWLENVSDDLDLTNVTVVRSRAEQCTDIEVDVVTSRAVARLDTLSGWSLPLLRSGGRMLALKGSSAQEEVDEARADLEALGGRRIEVLSVGAGVVDPPTAIVRVEIDERVARTSPKKRKNGSSPSRRAARRERQQHNDNRRK